MRRLCGRAAALALPLAALAGAAPPAAANDLRVSNLHTVTNNGVIIGGGVVNGIGRQRANAFTTGSNDGGYRLKNIKLHFGFKRGNPGNVRVRLYSSSGGNVGAALENLSGAASPNGGGGSGTLFTYASPSNWRLEPQTEYFVVIFAFAPTTPGNSYTVMRTNSNLEASDDGWTIRNERHEKLGFYASWQGTGNWPLALSVDAEKLAVSLTPGAAPTATGNTLTIANYPKAWYYKYTTPSGDASCTQVAAGVSTATVTGLSPKTDYTFKAYKDSSCATELTTDATDADFATLTPELRASDAEATTARLAISKWPHAWHYKYTAPSGGSCSGAAVPAGTSSTTSSTTLTDLSPGTSYTFKAYKDSSCNTELTSDSTDAEFLTKPGQVTGLASSRSPGSLLVTWAAVQSATGYTVQWKSGSQDYGADDRQAAVNGTSHTIADLTDNTAYEVRVRASNATGFGAWSAGFAAPSLAVGGIAVTSAQLTLSNWTAAWRYRNVSALGGDCSDEVAAGTEAVDVTGLLPATEYAFKAYSDSSCSMLLAAASAFSTPALATVEGVAVESLDRALLVSWSAVAGASGYEVQYRERGAAKWIEWRRRPGAAAGLSETITDLDNGAAYEVRVRAVGLTGNGFWSNSIAEAVGTPGAALRKRLAPVSAALAPEAARAFAGGAARAVSGRIARAVSGEAAPAPSARMLAGFVERHGEAASQGSLPLREALAGAAASLPFAGSQGGGSSGGGGLWVAGDYGRLAGGGPALAWEGSASGFYLGADAALGPGLLGGAALSVSEAAFDYADRRAGAAFKGEWTARMTGLHPYAARHWADGSVLWAAAGYGLGEVEIEDGEAGRPQEADSELLSLAAGGSVRLAPLSAAGPALALKGEALAARFEVAENNDLLEAVEADVHRVRLALAGEASLSAGPGASLAPSAELGLRHDGGDGETSFGLETGAGLAWAARRLRLAANARALLAHGGGVKEWGAGALASLEPDGRGRGLSLSLSPALGHERSGLDRLWEEGVAADGAASGARPAARLAADAGYGLPLPGASDLLFTPRIGLAATDGGQRRYSAGLALERGPQAALALEAARTQSPETPPETALTLSYRIRW